MHSEEIRRRFLHFFQQKDHFIIPSASIIVRDDPTLMFTNAGMNQFKDIFLGNVSAQHPRVADTQKCLRVSGKHNDLEEVGYDTYHHTMFEMLGNWSFGDYFKKEAISWAWEFLTSEIGLSKDLLYATVFQGETKEGLEFDQEAYDYWKKYLPENRIIGGNKKDNFWEMGETGPCGPCSEIHIDLRSPEERQKVDGKKLVNTGDPRVIEIWNLVFIEYNRKASGELELLPQKHVDTGMGFERLCRIVQKKESNYDTDLFQPIIKELEKISGLSYGSDKMTDVAMRIAADHIRALAFCIADGQIPSNVKAGYVLRRILRRAVRYGHTFLKQQEPFLYKLVPVLTKEMGGIFPELYTQQELITKVIREEEVSFLSTLSTGIRLLQQIMDSHTETKKIDGTKAFELYDTYGFPVDLTELIAREQGYSVDMAGFDIAMHEQKERSRNASAVDKEDWTIVNECDEEGKFVGYDTLEADSRITRYRKIKTKNKEQVQIVLDCTPFYAESGGQVGDTGQLISGSGIIKIINTIKENNLAIHIADRIPNDLEGPFKARVNGHLRLLTANNHTATHLLHHALRKVLGTHVEQKGSRVDPDRLRFDFSHFQKVTDEELQKVEHLVNEQIRMNLPRQEDRNTTLEEARKKGAMALFGEKYGNHVRMIQFGESIELCGGTHVDSTASIGLFKIVSESAIAAGIRRIEAITADQADAFIQHDLDELSRLRSLLNNPKDPAHALNQLIDENTLLRKQVEAFHAQTTARLQEYLLKSAEPTNGFSLIIAQIDVDSAALLKDISLGLKERTNDLVLFLGAEIDGKAHLSLMVSPPLVKERKLSASEIIKKLATEIKGGGGGQPFFATAGGSDVSGISRAIEKAREYFKNLNY